MNRWQLPDGVDELLPDAAWRVERLRRQIMDACHAWGFDLVMPPLIEYLDSLITGTGTAMELQTLKFIDQHNGRTLGVRADITPQVARMDAHALNRDWPNRLFYIGTVVRARTDGFGGSRSPQQFGAELFGHAGPEADIEIIRLMLRTLELAGVAAANLTLDLGHVGVYRGLVAQAALNEHQEGGLFRAFQRGSVPDIDVLLGKLPATTPAVTELRALPGLQGDPVIIDTARHQLRGATADVHAALDTLATVVEALRKSHPALTLHVDLGELRGYSYHTGMLFSAFSEAGQELARGGRYNCIGEAFGRPRPATGFSSDLKRLVDAAGLSASPDEDGTGAAGAGIFAGEELLDDAGRAEVSRLREDGNRVVVGLRGSGLDASRACCDRQLVRHDGRWSLEPVVTAGSSTRS